MYQFKYGDLNKIIDDNTLVFIFKVKDESTKEESEWTGFVQTIKSFLIKQQSKIQANTEEHFIKTQSKLKQLDKDISEVKSSV